ncbi:hypothetical protein DL93DRAFT_2082321 [Clavulina sp. PMI_390]|nr:hypothetical protein DL93DRAFT_2082321 [Clavulina sp. PMI_390]
MVLTYSYMKPRSPVREWIFRQRLFVESTLGFTMYEPWEKMIGWTILAITLALCLSSAYGIVFHLPRYITNRVNYYVLGDGQLSL